MHPSQNQDAGLSHNTPFPRLIGLQNHGALARQGTVVLEADEPWEGGVVAQPSVLVLGGVHRIYYATAGGIASAEGPSGGTFVKAALVLQPRQTGWDAGAVPESPGVIQREDGSLCMFYSAL